MSECKRCHGLRYISRWSRRRVGYTTCEHRDPCSSCGGTGEQNDREDAALDALIVGAFRCPEALVQDHGECPHGLPKNECADCKGEVDK